MGDSSSPEAGADKDIRPSNEVSTWPAWLTFPWTAVVVEDTLGTFYSLLCACERYMQSPCSVQERLHTTDTQVPFIKWCSIVTHCYRRRGGVPHLGTVEPTTRLSTN
jgi:hypothetical protein